MEMHMGTYREFKVLPRLMSAAWFGNVKCIELLLTNQDDDVNMANDNNKIIELEDWSPGKNWI